MNTLTKKAVLLPILFFLLTQICAADPASRQKNAKKFAEEAQRALPFTALSTLVWSDSYIGQLVSRKPHFGAGISYGMTMADFSGMKELLDDFGTSSYMDIGGVMMAPLFVHIRIGGFFVPFDIGFTVNIPLNTTPAEGFTLQQQTIGFDIRFALLRDGVNPIGLSFGFAYAWTDAGLRTSLNGSDIGIYWSGGAGEIKMQISKALAIFTPYLGGGGSFAWSQAGYESSGADEESWGMGPDDYANGVLFRIFGGVSMELWVFRLDVNMNISIPDFEYGVVAGLRFQL